MSAYIFASVKARVVEGGGVEGLLRMRLLIALDFFFLFLASAVSCDGVVMSWRRRRRDVER